MHRGKRGWVQNGEFMMERTSTAVGAAVGAFLALLLLLIVAVCCICRRR